MLRLFDFSLAEFFLVLGGGGEGGRRGGNSVQTDLMFG